MIGWWFIGEKELNFQRQPDYFKFTGHSKSIEIWKIKNQEIEFE